VLPPLVDIHSHVVPSGDDGVQSVDEGVMLCRMAAERGTGLLFATPHVWNHLRLTPERQESLRVAFDAVAARAGLELRLGFELTPHARLLGDDLHHYELEGTSAVLIEMPFFEPLDLLLALGEKAEAAGLQPVIAHPERIDTKFIDPQQVIELAQRGWLLQVNASSLTGQHGAQAKELGWQLVEEGHVSLAGSDGHRRTRPAHVDEAFELARERIGEEAARAIFDGSALGLVAQAPILAETSS
jgi:protein-tyrosine phosphatase